MPFLLIFAQTASAAGFDPISGGAGWVGAGLLGGVLTWLCFFYLPAKDKQAKEKDELILTLVREMQDKYTKSLKDVTDHCETEMKAVRVEVVEKLNGLRDQTSAENKETRHKIADLHHAIGLRRAVEQTRREKGLPPLDDNTDTD